MSRLFLFCLSVLSFAPPAAAEEQNAAPLAADLVVLNGKIWTVNRAQSECEALAVVRDRIAAVGTNAEVRQMIGPQTRVVDAQGRRIVPGFYDSHVHLLGSGLRLSEVALKDAGDEAEFGKRLREFDKKLPRDRWLLGGEWDHDRTFAGQLPTAELIDKYVADRPVFLRRYDGHMAVVNSRVLRLAGITAETPDPPGGVIYRKPGSRQPSGVLPDNAMSLVERHIPQPSEDEIIDG